MWKRWPTQVWCMEQDTPAGALGQHGGMGWGGRWEGGSAWGTLVHPWLLRVRVSEISQRGKDKYCIRRADFRHTNHQNVEIMWGDDTLINFIIITYIDMPHYHVVHLKYIYIFTYIYLINRIIQKFLSLYNKDNKWEEGRDGGRDRGKRKLKIIIIISTKSTHTKKPVHKKGIYKWFIKTWNELQRYQ